MALKTLYQILLNYDRSWLRVIARQWSIDAKSTSKPDLAAELVDGMATEQAVSRCLAQVTPEQREALDDMLRRDGVLPWAVFVRRWGAVRTVGGGRLEREELWLEPQSTAEALWFLGLVQRAFSEDTDHPVEMAFIPEELMLYMPTPPALMIPSPPARATPPHIEDAADTLADDLVTLWAELQRNDGSNDASLPEPHRDLLRTLCSEQGWLRIRDVTLNAEAVLAWLRSSSWAQASSLFSAWRESREWYDIAHVAALSPDPVKGWPTPPRESRAAFLEILAQCRTGEWYELADFVAYVKAYATDFLRPDGDYETWAPRSTATGAPLRGFGAWDQVEGEVVRHLICGPLTWLGAVRLGGNGPDRPDAFALTEQGAAWLGTGTAPEVEAPPAVTIAPDGQICVPARRRYERFQLSRIADRVTAPTEGPSPEDRCYIYRLSPSSLHRARQQRISTDRIIAFLEEASEGQALPEHLKSAIQHGYQQERAVSMSRVWLLRLPESRQVSVPGLAQLIQTRLTPEYAVVAAHDRDRVVALLREHGVLVEIDEG